MKFSFVTKSISSPMPARFFLPSEVKPYKDKRDAASNGITGSPQFAVLVNGEIFDYYSSTSKAAFVEKMLISAELSKAYPMKPCLKKETFALASKRLINGAGAKRRP